MRRAHVTTHKRRGASLVEFAFVAPVFFTLILGIIELGRGCMVQELLTEAARRGCRAGVIEGTSSAQITTAVNNYLSGLGISGDSVGISVNDAPVNTVDTQNMPAYTEITVVVSIPASSCTWLPASFWLSGTISGQFTMRRE
jgi:Flp pilus assembly protein TadG